MKTVVMNVTRPISQTESHAAGATVTIADDLAEYYIGTGAARYATLQQTDARLTRAETDGAVNSVVAPGGELAGVNRSTDASGNTVLVGADGTEWPLSMLENAPRLDTSHRYVIGDGTTAVSVAASAATVSHPIDMRGLRFSDATLHVILTGTGTAKATIEGSQDGVTNWYSMGDLLTGMVASPGSYILRMDATGLNDWDYLRVTVTETGGANAVSVKVRLYADSANKNITVFANTKNTFALGDETVGVSVAASATQETIFIDCLESNRADNQIAVKITGTGTAKLVVYGSGSPLSTWHSLGDLITGMTAGTYYLAMDHASMAYFPFYRFAIVETGGANAVVATVRVTQKIHATAAEKPKVLLLADALWSRAANWDTYDDAYTHTLALLTRMGYQVDVRAIDDVASTTMDDIGRAYEFVVIPSISGGFGWIEWTGAAGYAVGRLLKGATPIPVFVCGVQAAAEAKIQNSIGTATQEASAYRKVLWRGKNWYARAAAYQLAAKAHMTSGPTAVITKPTDSTYAVAWKFKGAAGWVYADASYNFGGDNILLMHLLAEAVMDGVIDAPPQKLPVVIDLDDTPDMVTGTQTMSDLDRLYTAMSRMSMPATIGIQANHLDSISAEMVAWVRARTADRGGLLYPIVHAGGWTWTAETKAAADTQFRSEVAACIAKGFRVGESSAQTDSWGYMYFNNNAFDEKTIQLASPERAMTSSPLNDSIMEGYGWRVARSFTIGGLNTAPIGANSMPVFGKTTHRGVLIAGSWIGFTSANLTLDLDDGSDGTTAAVNQCARMFTLAAAYLSPIYMHGNNFYQTGGTAFGTTWLELLADNYQAGLSNVVQFVHGAELVNYS